MTEKQLKKKHKQRLDFNPARTKVSKQQCVNGFCSRHQEGAMNFSQLKWQHWMPDLAQQTHPLSPQCFIARWPTIAPRIPATTAQTRPSDHHSQGKTSARPCDWHLKFRSDVFWKTKDISINPKVSECFCAEHWKPTLFWFCWYITSNFWSGKFGGPA